MKIIVINNFSRKLILFSLICILWVFIFLICNFLINKSIYLDVTVNEQFSFSHALEIKINDIFSEDEQATSVLSTNKGHFISVQSLSEFIDRNGNFRFNYPGILIFGNKQTPGGDITLHIDFHKNGKPANHGFIQVWNMQQDLLGFLNQSKQNSMQNFKYFVQKPVVVNGVNGYRWDYAIITGQRESIRGAEVFLKKDDKMYRISYFTPEKDWNRRENAIFNDIVNSFKLLQ